MFPCINYQSDMSCHVDSNSLKLGVIFYIHYFPFIFIREETGDRCLRSIISVMLKALCVIQNVLIRTSNCDDKIYSHSGRKSLSNKKRLRSQ